MVAGVVRRLGQLLDRDVGRGQVGVAEAEVDDVGAGSPRLDLQPVDDGEDVRRQVRDPAELHPPDGSDAGLAADPCPKSPIPGLAWEQRVPRAQIRYATTREGGSMRRAEPSVDTCERDCGHGVVLGARRHGMGRTGHRTRGAVGIRPQLEEQRGDHVEDRERGRDGPKLASGIIGGVDPSKIAKVDAPIAAVAFEQHRDGCGGNLPGGIEGGRRRLECRALRLPVVRGPVARRRRLGQ